MTTPILTIETTPKKVQRLAEAITTDLISLDGHIKSVRSNWSTKELSISLSASRDDSEYESVRLGEISRADNVVRVLFYQINESLDDAVKLNCRVCSVRLDLKTDLLSVSLVATGFSEDMVPASLRLGSIAISNSLMTARFEPSQKRLF